MHNYNKVHNVIIDRRPGTDNPLPFRGEIQKGEFWGYKKHNFLEDSRGLCVHHGGVSRDKNIPLEEYALWHMDRWDTAGGIAYTYAIEPDGKIIQCWDNDLRVYSQGWKDHSDNPESMGDENIKWKGVLVVGDFSGPHNPGSKEEPTAQQMSSLAKLRLYFIEKFGMSEITTHSVLGKPACPGETLTSWVALCNKTEGLYELNLALGLQRALYSTGYYSSKIDGIIGRETTVSIKKFQKDHSLVKDGVFGVKTKKKMTDILFMASASSRI